MMICGAVHAVLLAAGQSRRMGARNKLLIELEGEAMVRRAARRLLAAEPAGIVAVTGHGQVEILSALAGLGIRTVHNPAYATGMASSLRCGLQALPPDAAGALIALSDMPGLEVEHYRQLISLFCQLGGTVPVRAANGGRPGNPVILPRSLFGAAAELEGDRGARDLLRGADVMLMDIGAAASRDIDEPGDLPEARSG